MRKSLFGKFNPIIDEAGHAVLNILICGIAFLCGLPMEYVVISFVAGFAIDIDHLLNTFICKDILKVPNYQGTIFSGDLGYTPKILHGIDLALVVGFLVGYFINIGFGVVLFLTLSFHELWDFIVYSHRANELFFITRARNRFFPGKRTYWRGLIFDEDTLKW